MPTIAVDPDGQRIIFVNGYLAFGSPNVGKSYWNNDFVKGAESYFQERATSHFANVKFSYLTSATKLRRTAGTEYAKNNYDELTDGMDKEKDVFRVISHSMGGAFSEGIIDYLKSQGWRVEASVHLNTWEPEALKVNKDLVNGEGTQVIDATITNDPVQWLSSPVDGSPDIKNADIRVRKKSKKGILYRHRDLIDNDQFWKSLLPQAKELKKRSSTSKKMTGTQANALIFSWIQSNPDINVSFK